MAGEGKDCESRKMSLGTQLIANRKLKPRLGPPDVYPQVTLITIIIITISSSSSSSSYHHHHIIIIIIIIVIITINNIIIIIVIICIIYHCGLAKIQFNLHRVLMLVVVCYCKFLKMIKIQKIQWLNW